MTANEVRQQAPDRVGVWARMRLHGLMDETIARDPRMGSAYGRMALDGRLWPLDTPEARARAAALVSACERMEGLARAYRRVMCSPAGCATVSLERSDRGHDESDTEERDLEVRRAWSDAMNALGGEGGVTARAVLALIEDGREVRGYDLLNARSGLHGLVKLWGLIH